MTRSFGSFCSLLLVWLCTLGAGPARHSVAQSFAIRSAAEVTLREVAEAPRLPSRVVVSRTAILRNLERGGAPQLSGLIAQHRAPARRTVGATRTTRGHQAVAHASRPRFRAYDAAAPPALSRIAR